MSRCRPSGSCLETPSGRDRSCLVAKGLLMILRAAVSARSGRATAYSETGPYRHQRYRYHQISFLSGPASPPSGLGHSTVWQTSQMARQFPVTPFDRHRGGGHPPTPATPPCVRVRTRRFETVTLAILEQRRKPERFEVRFGEPYVEGFGERQIPRSATAAGHVGR